MLITAPEHRTFSLLPDEVLTVSADAVSAGGVWRLGNNAGEQVPSGVTVSTPIVAGSTQTIGPFNVPTRFDVRPSAGSLTVTQGLSPDAPISPNINLQTGTTYTLVPDDNGKLLKFTNGSAITVTVPAGLGAGFNCVCVQGGAGQVTFVASVATLTNRQSQLKIAGIWGVVGLFAPAADALVLSGDTA